MLETFQFSIAKPERSEELRVFLLEHGPNQWNYLPEEGVQEEFRSVARGDAFAVVAEDGELLVGFAVCFPRFVRFPQFTERTCDASQVGYIADVVVHGNYAGQGIGSQLLRQGAKELAAQGIHEIYIDCHEENLASRAMMRKAGFVELASYHDPVRRSSGSQRSLVCKFTA